MIQENVNFEIEWRLLRLYNNLVELGVVNVVQPEIGVVINVLHIELVSPLKLIVLSLTSVSPAKVFLVMLVPVVFVSSALLVFIRLLVSISLIEVLSLWPFGFFLVIKFVSGFTLRALHHGC